MALRTFGLALVSISISALVSSASFAGTAGVKGVCMADGQQMQLNNEQVIGWKTSTQSGWHGRGFVQGKMTKTFNDRSGHDHFELQIGPSASDVVEIIYNQGFGQLPNIQPGQTMLVCGDYITSNSRNGRFPPSPDGAIIHWVHGSPNGRHADGFISINGKVYGQDGDASRGRSFQNSDED